MLKNIFGLQEVPQLEPRFNVAPNRHEVDPPSFVLAGLTFWLEK
jgi:hypothetical protein